MLKSISVCSFEHSSLELSHHFDYYYFVFLCIFNKWLCDAYKCLLFWKEPGIKNNKDQNWIRTMWCYINQNTDTKLAFNFLATTSKITKTCGKKKIVNGQECDCVYVTTEQREESKKQHNKTLSVNVRKQTDQLINSE